MRDFFDILKELNLYDEQNHSKTEHIYTFENGSWVEFFSADDDQKLRGRKRDILICNEGNELKIDEFNQLVMRTRSKIFIDFNPSDTEHWIYDILNQENALLIKSTYKDNPFLSKDQVEYIENLINIDENYYRIYALGERPLSTTRIYSHFKQYYDDIQGGDIFYGLDFGFNHPTALLQLIHKDKKVWVKEMVYESKLTSKDLIKRMDDINISKSKPIYCDTARPEIIEELRRAGYKVRKADKSVKGGIDKIKSTEIYVHAESTNTWKEFKTYSWKTYKNELIDEPIKLNDDAMDALRYGVFSHIKKNSGVPFSIG